MPDGATARARNLTAQLLSVCLGLGLLLWAAQANDLWLERHVLPDFRISDAELRMTVLAARIAAAFVGAVLTLWAPPRLGRFVGARSARQLAADVLPTVLAMVLAFGAAEVLMRLILGPRQLAAAARHEPLRKPDPVLGWVSYPSRASVAVAAGRRVPFAFDSAGLRVRALGEQVDPRRPTILFAGESMMDGYGLTWGESVPAQVAAMTGVQAADLAVEGYSVDQAYLRLRQQLGRFEAPVAVVTLFLPSAVYRTLEPTHPALEPGLVWRPARDDWQLARLWRRHVPLHRASEVEAAITVASQALRSTAQMAKARGASALVVTPVLLPESAAERHVRERVLQSAGVAYVLVPIRPDQRLPNNRHPNAKGATAIATTVVARLRVQDRRLASHAGVPLR